MTLLLGVGAFTGVVLCLVALILAARTKLVHQGDVRIVINDDEGAPLSVPAGDKLLGTLADQEIYLPSACGAAGTCGQCKVKMTSDIEALPTDRAVLSRSEIRAGYRLACQHKVKEDMRIEIPPEVFAAKKWICAVIANENVATFIKEPILKIPASEDFQFEAGAYIQVICPAEKVIRFADFDIGHQYQDDWNALDLWRHESRATEDVMRAYSMANFPLEKDTIKLNVRIATPPPEAPKSTPPGRVSSYLFSLKPGDTVEVCGPFGDFRARPSECEMVVIGGGAGMAPLRSIVLDQLKRLKTRRKISFWYGARSAREMFYVKDFIALQKIHENFAWHAALSEPAAGDSWSGHTGFIHQVLYDRYLKSHPEPEDCEYYICGPGPMNSAVLNLLDRLGVEKENIYLDDFG